MRIAVTGATGFVGSHVLRALSGQGHTLVAAVRPGGSAAPLPEGIETVGLDLAEPGDDAFARLGRPDSLVHLAWSGLPHYGSSHHMEVELPRQRRFLESCLRSGLGHVVVAGTCLEYGLREGELREDMAADPSTAYGKAKQALCASLLAWRAELGFGLAWLRLFYVYGPGQAGGSLYPQVQAALQRGDASFPLSPGDQSRDFLPVERAAHAIATLAIKRADACVVNVCSGEPTSVLSLVQQWLRQEGSTMGLETGRFPYPSHEPFRAWGNRDRLDALLEAP